MNSVESAVILRLIGQVADPVLREQILTQYYQDVTAQTNFAQAQVIDIAMRLEQKFDEQVRAQFGVTNEMISEAVAEARASRQDIGRVVDADAQLVTALEGLSQRTEAGFHEIGEAVTDLRADLDDLKTRDARQYQESRADREQLNRRLNQAEQKLAALTARLDARPSPEKAQATYDGVQQMQADFKRILEHLGLTFDESAHAAGDG